MAFTILNLFLTGLVFSSGACLVTCGPVLFAYIAGTGKGPSAGLMTYMLFSAGKALAYILLNLAVFLLGEFVLRQRMDNASGYIRILGGLFICVIGLAIILKKDSGFFHPCLKFAGQTKKNAFFLGFVTGVIPCAPLLAVFAYIGLICKTWMQALYMSLFFAIGTFFSPLLILAFFAGITHSILKNRREIWTRILNFVCGLIIIIMGLGLLIRK